MNIQFQKKLSAYFGLQKLMYAQLFKVNFDIDTESKRLSAVRQYSDKTFQTRWIERAGPIPWSPRSSDLTLCDYLSWRYVIDFVFCEPPTTNEELGNKTGQEIETSDKKIKQCVQNHGN